MLNLPKKIYSMKANLKKKFNIFKNINILFLNLKIINFFLFDGPPFANGELHIGHILNKTIKDVLIKTFFFNNYLILSNIGWDCHGLPIEQLNLINNYFFLNCRKFVCKNIKLQKKNIINFNYFNIYYDYNTMEPRYESLQYKIYNLLFLKNVIKKEKIPILWCYKCCSSLSYSEILYKKINSFSFYIKIKFLNFLIVIWTTTLWSIINNQSIFFLKNQIYIVYKTKKNSLILLNSLFYKIIKKIKLKGKICSFINGFFFFKKKYSFFLKKIIIFFNKKNILLNNDYIDINIGSGFIHCAPSNGIEDYEIYRKKNINNFYNKKFFSKNLKNLNNINVFFISKIIFKLLKKRNIIINKNKIIHNYMFCWRHKKPIFYFLSNQLFINLNFEFKKNKIKKLLLNKIKKIFFFPNFIKKTLSEMIKFRNNWCISRQRYWGIPIIYDEKKIGFFKNLTKTFSSHIIFFLNKNKNNIFDVWFDSSILSLFINKKKIIIEGKDQIRGWYQSILIVNFFIFFDLNFFLIISHNFCTDLYGNKLSKSSKNFKSLKEILINNSDEIIKLFLLEHDFTKNILFNEKKIENTNFTYKIIRNFLKFIINNFYDFNFIKIKFLFFDYWIIKKINKFEIIIKKMFLNFYYYNIIKIIKLFINFINEKYFFYIKYNLYICKKFSIIRNSVLFSIYSILIFIKNSIFPILFYTNKEILFFLKNNVKKNIFFSNLLKINNLLNNLTIFYKKNNLLKIVKKDFSNIFSKKIFLNNFFWNWYIKKNILFKNKKKFYCLLSKDFKFKKEFILINNICKNCKINKFHNLEEIRFYA